MNYICKSYSSIVYQYSNLNYKKSKLTKNVFIIKSIVSKIKFYFKMDLLFKTERTTNRQQRSSKVKKSKILILFYSK